tara:strand:+ start:361 stop:573 length:213 start_codon:yes stop_codon:yes gene_type:complete
MPVAVLIILWLRISKQVVNVAIKTNIKKIKKDLQKIPGNFRCQFLVGFSRLLKAKGSAIVDYFDLKNGQL